MTNRVKENDNRAQDPSPFHNEDVSSVQHDPSPDDPNHPENNSVRCRVTMARRDVAKRNERGALVDGERMEASVEMMPGRHTNTNVWSTLLASINTNSLD